ncbi:PLP-dependent aminotransferase family protein [Massilia arenosa]|uniref:PLP-dependent aminotransferase family protein n=1 Tax=Zemynaea arenosa TaxID=2561931 RepID=A0A4Y9S8B2_9BURK|nr:PLP-dependent aminotransferase family protein [Massilia arenosa]TFW17583.1 PLP-dependent aminotransferase family protein [Massilia arenosa]
MHIADILSSVPLDAQARAPLFQQLGAGIRAAILDGAIAPGMRLPPTRTLCTLLGVSRQTVLSAYEQLTAEGYLEGTVGRGTFVAAHLPGRTQAPTQPARAVRGLSARGRAFAASMRGVRHHDQPARAFRASMPALELFPFDVWNRLEARRRRHPDHHFGYGDPAGYLPLRERLCEYLGAARGVRCTPEQVIITSGSQQALYVLAVTTLDEGDEVWLESPGYQGACAPLRAAGASIRTVPVAEDGLDLAWAERRLPPARLVFTTPSHHLPLGVTMSLPRRLELLAWARRHRAWIVEDDYDSEYRYNGPPLPSLQSLDHAGCVIYVGTLSKVLFPGLRLGYLVVPPGLAEDIARAKAVIDRHSPIVPQMALADFIAQGHFARHIRRTRAAYAERRAVLLRELDRHVPDLLRCGPSDAGLDLCTHFRIPLDEADVVRRCAAAGIELRGLAYYRNPNAVKACDVPPGLLLGFSSVPPDAIRDAVPRLAGALADAAAAVEGARRLR